MLTRKVDFEKYLSAICRDGIEARQPRPCRRWSARFLCQNVEMVLQTASLGPNGSKRQVIHHGIDAFTGPMFTRKVDFEKYLSAICRDGIEARQPPQQES